MSITPTTKEPAKVRQLIEVKVVVRKMATLELPEHLYGPTRTKRTAELLLLRSTTGFNYYLPDGFEIKEGELVTIEPDWELDFMGRVWKII